MALESASGRLLLGWFEGKGFEPSSFQTEVWDAYALDGSGMIHVPIRDAKIYAAYVAGLEELMESIRVNDGQPESGGVSILFVAPSLKSVADIALILKSPVEDLGLPLEVGIHLDTTGFSERGKTWPAILVVTPESFVSLLSVDSVTEIFSDVKLVIADEWQELLGTKRGTQMELALARLRKLSAHAKIWALSENLENLEEAACSAVGLSRTFWIIRTNSASDAPPQRRAPLLRPLDILSEYLANCSYGLDEGEIRDELSDTVAFASLSEKEFKEALSAVRSS